MNKRVITEQELQIEIDNQEEWEDLLERDGLKVVDVNQEWSGPCQSILGLFKLINEQLDDKLLIFATACAQRVNSLIKYRGRSEPYFLFFGGASLVAVVKGADPPKLDSTIKAMLKQEHDVLSGEVNRIVIEDEYLKALENAKKAAEKKEALEIEIDQETAVLLIHPDVDKEISEFIIDLLEEGGFEIQLNEEHKFDKNIAKTLLKSEESDENYNKRLGIISKGTSRCLLLTKGPYGVIEALAIIVGPGVKEEGADGLGDQANPEEALFPTIRDYFGKGDPKSLVTYTNTPEQADEYRQLIFPSYQPERVVVYREEYDSSADENEYSAHDSDSISDSETSDLSSSIPEYSGLPRLVLMVRPTAALHYSDKIKHVLANAGFEIQNERAFTFSEDEAFAYFEDLQSSRMFDALIAETISGPTLFLVVAKLDVYKDMRDLLGPESYSQAVENFPQSLRAMFSSLPGVEKLDDITWLEATTSDPVTELQLDYFFPIENTLAALKPDIDVLWDELVVLIKGSGFKIVDRKEHQMTIEDVKVVYHNSIEKPFFEELVDNLTSAPSLFLVLQCQDGVQQWRKLMGRPDPDKVIDSYPDDIDPEKQCLRAIYGKNCIENALHGSSSTAHAKICIKKIFGEDWFGSGSDFLSESDGLSGRSGENSLNDEELDRNGKEILDGMPMDDQMVVHEKISGKEIATAEEFLDSENVVSIEKINTEIVDIPGEDTLDIEDVQTMEVIPDAEQPVGSVIYPEMVDNILASVVENVESPNPHNDGETEAVSIPKI